MNSLYKILTLFFLFGFAAQSQDLTIRFDGEQWWKKFQGQHEVELYNAPYSLKEDKPHFLWKSIGEGGSLLFDGYSTYMELKDYKFPEKFVLSFWIAPRAFDSAADNKLSAILDYSAVNDSIGFKVGIFKHGQLVTQYATNTEKIRFTNDQLYLHKNQWNFVQVKHDPQHLQVFINGNRLLDQPLEQTTIKQVFAASDYTLTLGRNSQASGFGEKFKFNMISGLLDEFTVRPSEVKTDEKAYAPRSVTGLKEQLRLEPFKLKDEFRPGYHAMAPAHWMNEPHAPLYYNGKYHLFYQHNPFGPYWGQIHWGHWVSDDMVSWNHTDIALAPEKGSLDPDGIWSGSAYVGPNDTPLLFYTAANYDKAENQYTSIAFAKDKNDENLVQWKKTGIIVDKPSEYLHNEFRDPFVFQIDKLYYMIVGSGIAEKGGTAALFESTDAREWRYLHPLYLTDIEKYPYLGGVWELPIFLPLTDSKGKPTDKYVLMVLPLRNAADVEVFYWVGNFDRQLKKFIPDEDKPSLLDYGDFGFTGPSGLVDPKTNRSIVFSIAQGKYGKIDTYDMGWAHNAGLPIHVWLGADNDLRFTPIEELKSLRRKPVINCNDCRVSTLKEKLKKVNGDQLEINLQFKPGRNKQGIIVRQSHNKDYQAMIYYDPEISSIVFNKIQQDPEREFTALEAPIEKEIEVIKLRIFLDRSMVEIYINDQTSITDRIYFTDPEAVNMDLMGFEDGDRVKKLTVWPMNSIEWNYAEPSTSIKKKSE